MDDKSKVLWRPSEMMRARRPELFSDSDERVEPHISREAFELELENLTSKKKELDFETFCRRLAEKELCPNLLPQTGPTGGGDSKVDSETYPVADEIALRWYVGDATAAKERWAFAFSAKKKWRSKVRSDIKAIAETNRGYRIAYFITNQFVKDKDRAAVETELSAKWKLDVRILDRSWILKCVFEHARLPLAVDSLRLSKDSRPSRIAGPEDARRDAELRQLETEIEDPARYKGVRYQLAEDCLRAALLARGLERPRAEVEGRHDRALRVAESVGNKQQILRITYSEAWTAYWWFEDFAAFLPLYLKVEALALKSDQATDLELLCNLWSLLFTSVVTGQVQASEANLDERTGLLKQVLTGLSADRHRPNNSLWARTSLCLMNIQEARLDPSKAPVALRELHETIKRAKGMIAYPMEVVSEIVQELGKVLVEDPEYAALLDDIVGITEQRTSASAAGEMLLKRGFQMLDSDKPFDAIRFFGRAQAKLGLRESRGELVSALAGCGHAYEDVGLLWAARSKLLAAANQTLSEFSERGLILPQALICLRRVVWLELRLGRPSHAIRWMEAASLIARHLKLDERRWKSFVEECEQQDRIMGILLLRSSIEDLKNLDFLPTQLERKGLHSSWMALLFALGHEDHLRTQGVVPPPESSAAVLKFFADWLQVPAAKEVSRRPDYSIGPKVLLKSRIIGCDVVIDVENSHYSVCLAEHILGALESLLATSLGNDVVAHCQEFRVQLVLEKGQAQPKVEFDDKATRVTATVHYSLAAHGVEGRNYEWLSELLLGVLARIAMIQDIKAYFKRVLGGEQALNRAVNFSETATPIRNILGEKPSLGILEQRGDGEEPLFPLSRRSAWFESLEGGETAHRRPMKPGAGPVPEDMLDSSKWKHSDRRVLSIINIPLWNRAGWRAAGFLFAEGQPPIFALGFKDGAAGKAIFQEWRDTLGQVDERERIRVSVITNVKKKLPFSYKVMIGANFLESLDDAKQIIVVSRVCQMDPLNSNNLEMLRAGLARHSAYYLVPALLTGSTFDLSNVYLDYAIGKRSLVDREAWQLGDNDQDLSALAPDDDPVLPASMTEAPVLKALAKIRRSQT